MTLDSPSITPGIWAVIGMASLLVTGGSICMLAMSLRRPRQQIATDDYEEEGKTRSEIVKQRTSSARQSILGGMVRRRDPREDHSAVTKTNIKKAAPEPPPVPAVTEAPMGTGVWSGMWSGITDSKSLPQPDQAPEPELQSAPDSIIPGEPPAAGEPVTCPFCSHISESYEPQDVDGGTIYSCPACHCIAYVVPVDIAHKYMGRTYHVPEGKAFVPTPSPAEAMKDLPIPAAADVSVSEDGGFAGLFDSIVD